MFVCDDALNVTCRVIDMARRLGLGLETLALTRTEDGRACIRLALEEPQSEAAEQFRARVRAFLTLLPEPCDV